MGPRDQAGRLSHDCAHRQRPRAIADSDRPRLDGQIPSIIAALANVKAKTAYIDGELCGIDEAGLPSFAKPRQRQTASAERASSITRSISCTWTAGTFQPSRSSSASRFLSR